MTEVLRKPVKVNNVSGEIVYDMLCANGPVDPKTGEPLIDPETGEPYPGENDDMAFLIHKYLVTMRETIYNSNQVNVPRFGVLSLLAQSTPIYVYDHPAFKKIANTAFTDGINVFIDADFMRKLAVQEQESNGSRYGVAWILLHELMHKLYRHTERLRIYPSDLANIAEDYVINAKLVKSFKEIPPVQLLTEMLYGTSPEDAEKYHSMAEEVVAEMLLRNKRKQDRKDNSTNAKGSAGSGTSSGAGQSGGSDPSQSEEEQKKESSDGEGSGKSGGKDEEKDGENQEYSHTHHISPEELIKIIEENGLMDTVGKALNLPSSDDVEKIGVMKEKAGLNITDAIETAISGSMSCNGNYPGSHIAEHAAEIIGGLGKGKLSYKLAIRKHFLGDGQKLHHTDDEASIPWYLDKETMGVDPFYTGALVPQAPDESVLTLIDTSGSTKGGNMRKEFLQEALGLKRSVTGQGDAARKVYIMSADTVIRGEPVLITDYNVETFRNEGIPVFGDGGTCFATCLKQALESDVMKKEKVKSVIYFTDCYDAVPKRSDFEEYLEKGIKIVFITTPGCYNELWNNELKWAEVYCIEENTVVDLEKPVTNNKKFK